MYLRMKESQLFGLNRLHGRGISGQRCIQEQQFSSDGFTKNAIKESCNHSNADFFSMIYLCPEFKVE